MTTARILDCGHGPGPHSKYTTGTAHTPDNQEICWDCAYQVELASLKTATKYIAYLVEVAPGRTELQTWIGQRLARVTELVKRRHNIAGHMYYFKAVDESGTRWYGTSTGLEMCAHMRRNAV